MIAHLYVGIPMPGEKALCGYKRVSIPALNQRATGQPCPDCDVIHAWMLRRRSTVPAH